MGARCPPGARNAPFPRVLRQGSEGMGQVLFYHLTQSGVEDTARLLLTRALGQGWRVFLRGTDRGRLQALDDALWLRPEDGFLPHGPEGGPHDAEQPVLLGLGPAVNGARAILLVDGAVASATEARAAERVWLLFDGGDPAAVEAARAEWRRLTAEGLGAQYWAEEGGRWQLKTERPAGG